MKISLDDTKYYETRPKITASIKLVSEVAN